MKHPCVLFVLLFFAALSGQNVFAQTSTSIFSQRILDLKRGQLPPAGFVAGLEKHDEAKFARAVCLHETKRSPICRQKLNPSVGWALCVAGSRDLDECNLPKKASIGFGLCMAGGRDVTDCNYVEGSTAGFGLCMASGRSFHECSAHIQPTLAFGYCMGRNDDVSNCLNIDNRSNKPTWVQN